MSLANILPDALAFLSDLPVWGLVVLGILLAFWFVRDTGSAVPWFSRKTNRPAVYLFHSVGQPHLVKVGYTARKTEARQAELERRLGDRLVLVRRIRMPHAYVAEQLAHRYLGAKGWRLEWSKGLGGEWYLVPGDRGIVETARLMECAAREVEKQARRRFSWHRAAEITIHDTPALPVLS